MRRRCARGLTLIELMVALAIAGVLAATAGPFLVDYMHNSRLRESGHTVLTEALMAQSEAIKRNTAIRLQTTATTVQVIDITDINAPVVLRTRTLGNGVTAAAATVDFGGEGRPTPFGTAASIDLSYTNGTCSTDMRCPGLRIDGGGGIRLCGDHTSGCA